MSKTGSAQTYTNNWINYNQEYYKIKVAQDGIYRLDRNALINAGFSATSIDPRKIQIFHNGQQLPVYIEGEADGVFDASDFIEFYGQRNDGSFDTPMYADPTYQPAIEFSLFNDTSVYFLTYNPLANGSRITSDNTNNYSSYTPAAYFMNEVQTQGRDVQPSFFFGYNRGMNDQSIDYTMSEGWGAVFGNFGAGNYPITFSVSTDKIYGAGPDVEMDFTFAGVNTLQHNTSIAYAGNTYYDTAYYDKMLRRVHLSTPTSTFTTASTNFVFNSYTANPATNPDYSMMYCFYVTYPHTYDMEGKTAFKFKVNDDGSQSMTRADFTNFNGGSAPLLYDLTNNKRILVTPNGATYQALIGNDGSATPKTCYLTNTANILTPTIQQINYVSSNAGHFNDIQAMQTDSAFIIITNRVLWSEANSYKTYRNTTYNNHALILDVNELIDQFAYGIGKHPLGIKYFANYILNNWTTAPAQHIFLIGKSVSPADYRLEPSLYSMNMVSSYGVPSSDMLLTAGINGSQWDPAIPIGRLSAQDGQTVLNYLQKVTEYENAQAGPPQPWMKEILHFGGGDDQDQQNQLGGYLNNYKTILEDSLFGGHVTTYLKFTSNPILINQSDSLQAQIDSGVAIMTFFGHASGASFDASTDEPSAYNNQGRYPIIVANSCFAGDFHSTVRSLSEKFVMEPQKAAIGFLASVGQGTAPYLYDYTSALFDHASHDMYGSTIGQLMKAAIQTIQPFGDEAHKIVSNEMSFQGDPSLRLNHFDKPDYSSDESQIAFTPSRLTTDLDTFGLQIITRNFGKAVQDSFIVKVTRTYPDGLDSVFTYRRGRCYYADTLNITMTTGGFSSAGLNNIKVEVDLPDSVNEYDNFFNNSSNSDVFIFSKDIIPVYPPKFAIHPYNTVTLKANTSNPFAGVNSYVFQIDTVDMQIVDSVPGMQHSPLFRFSTVADSGGVISWSPQSYQLIDSVVYYWRVANDSINVDPTKFSWQESSLQYIPGKSGWAQSDFYQFKEDDLENIDFDTLQRKFSFVYNNKSLRVYTAGNPNGTNFRDIGYYFNNSPVEYDGCQVAPAIHVAVLDSISLQPWTTCDYSVQQANTFYPASPGFVTSVRFINQHGHIQDAGISVLKTISFSDTVMLIKCQRSRIS
ncbi:MAG: hypothetical protein IPP51_03480 [Bacteroidetes bacterium]|nr:hypothetical protein [Bacteroidota bacterium]